MEEQVWENSFNVKEREKGREKGMMIEWTNKREKGGMELQLWKG
jgi:hypothetical protein